MQIPNLENIKTSDFLKIAGIAVVVLIVIIFAVRLVKSSFSVITRESTASSGKMTPMYDVSSEAMGYGESGEMGLSVRNIADSIGIPPTPNNTIPGDDAEEYEVTEYNTSIETRNKDNVCAIFEDLKQLDYVIFESASAYDNGCYFRFKVKNENVGQVLDIIESMDPKDFSENTYTIKTLVDDYTSEVEILEKKKASIEETLESAVKAYDDITNIATRTQNAEALAKIIDSKIGIIERLTDKKININSQLERLARSKAEQLDRILYTNFYVNVTENKYIDVNNLKDSWKIAIKKFVRDINISIQDISVNLIAVLFSVVQYIIYFFILLFAVKYGWKIAKQVWRK